MNILRLSVLLLSLLCATTSANGQVSNQWAGTAPFDDLPPDEARAALPESASDEALTEFSEKAAASPGLYDPRILGGVAQRLEVSGRQTDAQTLYAYNLLRSSTMARACGDQHFTTVEYMRAQLLQLLPVGIGPDGTNVLRRGVNAALALDASTPFAFQPSSGWCAEAFEIMRSPTSSSTHQLRQRTTQNSRETDRPSAQAILRDAHGFVALHLEQRARLQDASLSILEAAEASITLGLAPFALGPPNNPNPSNTARFLQFYEPEVIPAGATPIGRPLGMSGNGQLIVFESNYDGRREYTFASTLYGRRSQPTAMPAGFGPIAIVSPSGQVLSARRIVCAAPNLPLIPWILPSDQEMYCPAQAQVQLAVISPQGALTILEIPAPILSTDRRWAVTVIEISANGRWVLLRGHGYRSREDREIAYIIVDLEHRAITQSAWIEDEELISTLDAPWSTRIAENRRGEPILVVRPVYRPDQSYNAVRLVRLSPWSVQEIDFPTELRDYSYSAAAGWIQEGPAGTDVRPSMRTCARAAQSQRCRFITWSPNKQFVLYQRNGELVLVRQDGSEEVGTFPMMSMPMVQSSADGRVLVLSQAGQVQAYQYRARH